MLCPACHHTNEPATRFCDQCGQPFEVCCPACERPNRVGAQFCSHCGQSLLLRPDASAPAVESSPAPEHSPSWDDKLDQLQRYLPCHLTDKILAHRGRLAGERKLVSVLFANLAGSTALSTQLGEEDLFVLMDNVYELLVHEVHRYAGTVNELTGDGLVAFFGAPLAIEQAPQRAVRAALALQEAVARLSARVEPERGVRLHLRVGINTGPVIVGSVGNNLRMDYKAVGYTLNLAACIQQSAAPGTVEMTEHTYKLVEGYFDCDDLGLMHVKDTGTKTRVYRVRGERATRARIDVARERGFTRLVGRERELALLRQCLEFATAGRGQAVSIIGDAGLGKSRLLYEFRQTLAGVDCTWLDGRCVPYDTAPAYAPVVEVLKQYFDLGANDSAEDMQHKIDYGLAQLGTSLEATVPSLFHLLVAGADGDVLAGMPPEAVKHQLFEALRGLVCESAAQRPLVLAFEDLHWVDQTTEEFVTFLLEHLAASRVLLVCTYRPEFVCTWSRKSYHSVITLPRFGHAEGYQMLTALLGTDHIQDDLATFILEKAEGVPFFLEELVKSLRETGTIERQEEHWRLAARGTVMPVPDTVEEVLMARIDRLPVGAKSVLQMGAVMGREFGWELLREVAGLPEPELTAHLAALSDAELLYARGLPPQATYLFKHAFTQEAAYRSLLTARRRELHHRVAVTLEALFPDRLEEADGQLAHHYFEAGEGEGENKALEYAMRAGARHMAMSAYAEAARFYHMAMAALERQEPMAEASCSILLLALGEAHMKAGDVLQATEAFQRAAECGRVQGSPEALAHAALGLAESSWRPGGPAGSTIRLLEEVLGVLGEEDSSLKALVLSALTRALINTGSPEQATIVGQQAVHMARRLGDLATLAAALEASHYTMWKPQHSAEKLAAATEVMRLAEAVGDRDMALEASSLRLFDLMELGDIQAMEEQLAAQTRLADELRQPFYQYISMSFRAMWAIFAGHFAEGERLAQQALALGQHLPGQDTVGLFSLQMFTLRREQGRLPEVASVIRHAVRTSSPGAVWRPGLAVIYSELSLTRETRTEFEHLAADNFTTIPQDALWGACMVYLAEVCTFLGDARRAVTLYQCLTPYDGYNIVVGPTAVSYGAAARYLGMLAATMSHWEDAQRHFDDALAMNARMGARPWLAHTQYQYAVMLLARSQPGDREKAMSLLDEALSMAHELGMYALAERLLAHLEQRPAPAPAALDMPNDLSQREAEVLGLLAAGKSNRDIADALCISISTVASHVRHILTKTGCANRTEAAAHALRHALTEQAEQLSG